jgi:hypothetical protein
VVVVVSVVGGSLPIRASRKWLCHGGSISAPLGYIGLVLNSINFSRDRPILERQLERVGPLLANPVARLRGAYNLKEIGAIRKGVRPQYVREEQRFTIGLRY